ncbi:MAG: oligopeptide transport ATP-binding protein appF, partial [Deltaproteobacteria bacterium]|nr:oligopeptide transport ATP-binding protein appF [Deltaproteobacteria bacterium]
MTTLLEARRLTKDFGGGLFDRNTTVALEDFSLAIDSERPSITAVVGESGSGKTTLARLLLGLVSPSQGQVLYQGRDLQAMRSAEMRTFRRDVQVIFQDPYEVYNPFYRVDHVLTTPVSKFKLASTKAEARGV